MTPVIRRPSVTPPVVSATPKVSDKYLKSRWSDQSLDPPELEFKKSRSIGYRATSNLSMRSNHSSKTDPKKDQGIATGTPGPIINISSVNDNKRQLDKKRAADPDIVASSALADDAELANSLADELDFVTVDSSALSITSRQDKASRVLGIRHRKSMEPIPASARNSIVSTRSVRDAPPTPSFTPTLPLTSLYVVSGLPKSPHTWTLADPDSVMGLHHTDAAVSRWWRPEVLGSTVSPGCGGGKRKKKGKGEGEIMKGAGALSKQEVGKMLSKALKVCR
jgi:EEF1A N-terminal glycine/lysine methyltransferase